MTKSNTLKVTATNELPPTAIPYMICTDPECDAVFHEHRAALSIIAGKDPDFFSSINLNKVDPKTFADVAEKVLKHAELVGVSPEALAILKTKLQQYISSHDIAEVDDQVDPISSELAVGSINDPLEDPYAKAREFELNILKMRTKAEAKKLKAEARLITAQANKVKAEVRLLNAEWAKKEAESDLTSN